MSKYKLQVEYPGSPPKGTIIEYKEGELVTIIYPDGGIYLPLDKFILNEKDVISYRFFWGKYLGLDATGLEVYAQDLIYKINPVDLMIYKEIKESGVYVHTELTYLNFKDAQAAILTTYKDKGFFENSIHYDIKGEEVVYTSNRVEFRENNYDNIIPEITNRKGVLGPLSDLVPLSKRKNPLVNSTIETLTYKLSKLATQDQKDYTDLGDAIGRIIHDLPEENKEDFFTGLNHITRHK